MSRANCKEMNCTIYRQLAEIRMSASDRQDAAHAMRDAELIADAVVWAKEKIAALGAVLPKLGFKH